MLFAIAAAQFWHSHSRMQAFQFPCILTDTCPLFFDDSYLTGSFDLRFFDE